MRRLTAEEKSRRGTLRPSVELGYAARALLRAGGLLDETAVGPTVEARPYVEISAQYAADVVAGRIVACRWVRLACARQLRDLEHERDPFWPYVWEPASAAAACHFVEQCPHVTGRWETPGIRLEPWQVFLVTVLFGWRCKGDRSRRRFTVFYFEVARKAAKTTLLAALAFYHLLREDEPGASVICGASTGQQARMVFQIMQKMARASPWLRGQGVEVFANSIVTPQGEARPVNSKATSLDGLNPSWIILDESHAQDFELHNVLISAQVARGNPLLLCPTTAGYDLLSVGYALHQQVEKVLDQIFENEQLLGVIYTLDEGDDWRDEAVWIKANPMIGVSPKLDNLQEFCLKAQQVQGAEAEFRVKACCQWQKAAFTWLSMTDWDACADPTLRLEDFYGQPCWLAGDMAQIDDLSAIAYLFKQADLLVGFVRCYLPEDVIAERERAVPEYRRWLNSGILVGTEGTLTDMERVGADVRAACGQFKVQQIVFDQFGSGQLAGALAKEGLPAIVEPKNAKTFTGPARELEARVKYRRFRHDGNSLLKWSASNCVVTRRIDGSILPKKESAESANKIDPIDALLQSIGAWLRGQQQTPKAYQMLVLGGAKRPA